MKIYQYIFVLFFCIIVCSCSSEIKEVQHVPISKIFDTTLKSGIVNFKVLCKADTNVSYALYLPGKYKANTSFPVILLFDSHAKGVLPVEKYKNIADRFGYIIAGSNNSKNGLPLETTNMIGRTIKSDLLQRFSIDEKRFYVGGFSGGARVAGALAIADTSIAGVIGCSAGLPLNNLSQRTFNFVGIAGINDMNYNELVILEKTFEKSNLSHILLTFDGKHEWAPIETMHDAFLWLHLSAVKNKTIERNEDFIKDFELTNNDATKTAKDKKENYKALILYKKLTAFLNGIFDISFYQKEIATLENLPDVKNSINEKEKSETKEQALQQAYMEALQTKDIAWWKAEAGKLNEKIGISANSFEKAMFNRIFGFLSLASFSYVNRSLQTGDIKAAEHFNAIYEIVDPTIPDQKFFAACIYAKKGDEKKVISSLYESIKLGLTDVNRIKENEFLKPFITAKEFDKIVEKIKQSETKK